MSRIVLYGARAGQHFTFGYLPVAAAAQCWFNLPRPLPIGIGDIEDGTLLRTE